MPTRDEISSDFRLGSADFAILCEQPPLVEMERQIAGDAVARCDFAADASRPQEGKLLGGRGIGCLGDNCLDDGRNLVQGFPVRRIGFPDQFFDRGLYCSLNARRQS